MADGEKPLLPTSWQTAESRNEELTSPHDFSIQQNASFTSDVPRSIPRESPQPPLASTEGSLAANEARVRSQYDHYTYTTHREDSSASFSSRSASMGRSQSEYNALLERVAALRLSNRSLQESFTVGHEERVPALQGNDPQIQTTPGLFTRVPTTLGMAGSSADSFRGTHGYVLTDQGDEAQSDAASSVNLKIEEHNHRDFPQHRNHSDEVKDDGHRSGENTEEKGTSASITLPFTELAISSREARSSNADTTAAPADPSDAPPSQNKRQNTGGSFVGLSQASSRAHASSKRAGGHGDDGDGNLSEDSDDSEEGQNHTTKASKAKGAQDQIPCFIKSCKGQTPTFSELLRIAERAHQFYFCVNCLSKFQLSSLKDDHLCKPACISPTCKQVDVILDNYEMSPITAGAPYLHPRRAGKCPSWKQLSKSLKWKYLFTLAYPGERPPDPVFARGGDILHINQKRRRNSGTGSAKIHIALELAQDELKECQVRLDKAEIRKQHFETRAEHFEARNNRLCNIIQRFLELELELLAKAGENRIKGSLRSSLKEEVPELLKEHENQYTFAVDENGFPRAMMGDYQMGLEGQQGEAFPSLQPSVEAPNQQPLSNFRVSTGDSAQDPFLDDLGFTNLTSLELPESIQL